MLKGDVRTFIETSESQVGDRKGIEVINNGSYYSTKIVLVVDALQAENAELREAAAELTNQVSYDPRQWVKKFAHSYKKELARLQAVLDKHKKEAK